MEDNITPSASTPPPTPPPLASAPSPVSLPPVIRPPASAKPTRRGRGWMVLALVLLVLLGISMLFNLGSLASGMVSGKGARYGSARPAGPRIDEVVLEDNDASDKIAVIEIDGIITSRVIDQGGFSMVDMIKAQLKRAEEDERVKAVMLKVDSPGGEVLASDEIYRAIASFQHKTKKPVVATMGSVAASGGYYVSAPCRWIVANDLTITGSIGVIMSSWNYRGLMDKVGLVPQTFKSGKFKDMLSGSKEPNEITEEEKAMVQDLINETFAKFKTVVRKGRDRANESNKDNKGSENSGQGLSEKWEDYADGRVLSGTEAFNLGFVDELGDFENAVARTKKLAGLTHGANLAEYQQRYDISDLFRLFGKSESRAIKVDLGMEMPKLQAGQLYFLSPTFVY